MNKQLKNKKIKKEKEKKIQKNDTKKIRIKKDDLDMLGNLYKMNK